MLSEAIHSLADGANQVYFKYLFPELYNLVTM